MRIAITHRSEYAYDGPPATTVQALRLTPAPVGHQSVLSWRIAAPGYASACSYVDGFGNKVDLVAAPGDISVLVVSAEGVIETRDAGGVVGWTQEAVVADAFLRATAATAISADLAVFARALRLSSPLATLHALMEAVHLRVAYEVDSTHAHTSAAEAFAAGRGVCQDHAHILITAARELGIPARYVTGYLLLDDGGLQAGGGEGGDGIAASSAAHHAWAEAMVPDIGWIGFDAANCLCPTDRYVCLGIGLDAASAAPIRGLRRGVGGEMLSVRVDVREIGAAQTQSQQ